MNIQRKEIIEAKTICIILLLGSAGFKSQICYSFRLSVFWSGIRKMLTSHILLAFSYHGDVSWVCGSKYFIPC